MLRTGGGAPGKENVPALSSGTGAPGQSRREETPSLCLGPWGGAAVGGRPMDGHPVQSASWGHFSLPNCLLFT